MRFAFGLFVEHANISRATIKVPSHRIRFFLSLFFFGNQLNYFDAIRSTREKSVYEIFFLFVSNEKKYATKHNK